MALLATLCFFLFGLISHSDILLVWGTNPAVPSTGTMVHFYKLDKTRKCPAVENFVKEVVQKWYFKDMSITAALLRMHYSDCFVRGCDASILLDGYNGNQPEKKAPQNLGLRAFDVIDDIKTVLENKCPGVVSCADILALAARDVLSLAGGPAYPVPTGRKDGLVSSMKEVNLPGPNITLKDAIALFKTKGLEMGDLVTLLGAHNVGKAHCQYFRDRLYNFKGSGKADPSMNADLVASLKKECPLNGATNSIRTDPAVFMTPASGKTYVFDNSYYMQIKSHRALLGIDQALAYDNTSFAFVKENANNFDRYKFSVAYSMSKMSVIGVLTGTQGEIRHNCRIINKNNPNYIKPMT